MKFSVGDEVKIKIDDDDCFDDSEKFDGQTGLIVKIINDSMPYKVKVGNLQEMFKETELTLINRLEVRSRRVD